jgi:hypothetical protein
LEDVRGRVECGEVKKVNALKTGPSTQGFNPEVHLNNKNAVPTSMNIK